MFLFWIFAYFYFKLFFLQFLLSLFVSLPIRLFFTFFLSIAVLRKVFLIFFIVWLWDLKNNTNYASHGRSATTCISDQLLVVPATQPRGRWPVQNLSIFSCFFLFLGIFSFFLFIYEFMSVAFSFFLFLSRIQAVGSSGHWT